MCVVVLSNDTRLGYFVPDRAMPLNALATEVVASGQLNMPLLPLVTAIHTA